MASIRKKKLFWILTLCVILVITFVVFLVVLPSENPKWLIVGNVIKIINSNLYANFKKNQQNSRLKWFDNLAQGNTNSLHAASGWGYMSENQFNSMVDHVLQEMPIKSGDSVFELGCGVGAVLRRIRQVYGTSISVRGSDLSVKAITKIREVFPNEVDHFYVLSMTQKNDLLPDNSQDHVISVGGLAMYLYEEEMEKALQEAIRLAKPGGHLCFTHFVEPRGNHKGSILEPIDKSHWSQVAKQYLLENLIVKQMIHQKDRYFVCFSKRL